MISTPIAMLSPAKHAPIPSQDIPCDQLTKKEKTRAQFTCDGLSHYEDTNYKSTARALPPLDNPERHRQRDIFTVGRASDIYFVHTFCLKGKVARCADYSWVHELYTNRLERSGLWKEHDCIIGRNDIWGRSM